MSVADSTVDSDQTTELSVDGDHVVDSQFEDCTQNVLDSAAGSTASPSSSVAASPDEGQFTDTLHETQPESIESDILVHNMAKVLSTLASTGNDPKNLPCADPEFYMFHSISPPSISVHDYLESIHKYFRCSDACLAGAMVYIYRLLQRYPDFAVNDHCIHRLLAVSVVISVKINDDIHYNNGHFATVCGLSVTEMNFLEATLLKLLNWEVHITSEEYEMYQDPALSST